MSLNTAKSTTSPNKPIPTTPIGKYTCRRCREECDVIYWINKKWICVNCYKLIK